MPRKKGSKNKIIKKIKIKCKICKKIFEVFPYRVKKIVNYCSRSCAGHRKLSKETKIKISESMKKLKERHHSWKGGKIGDGRGYINILVHRHPFATKDGYIKEHRLVMEKHIGRYLRPEEVVHHKGIKYAVGSVENKQDNRIENLQLFKNNSEHMSFHQSLKQRRNK